MLQEDIEIRGHFLFTLEWLLAVQRRYADALRFGLIRIAFRHPQALGDAFGARDATYKLVEVSSFLRTSLRKADLVMRDGADFWVLVPLTAPETVTDKVRQIVESAARNGLDIVERDISVFEVPGADPKTGASASAEAFLAGLKRLGGDV